MALISLLKDHVFLDITHKGSIVPVNFVIAEIDSPTIIGLKTSTQLKIRSILFEGISNIHAYAFLTDKNLS